MNDIEMLRIKVIAELILQGIYKLTDFTSETPEVIELQNEIDQSLKILEEADPYYSLRKYDTPDVIIGGREDCQHE